MSTSNSEQTNRKLVHLVDIQDIKAIPHRFARGLDRCDRDIGLDRDIRGDDRGS